MISVILLKLNLLYPSQFAHFIRTITMFILSDDVLEYLVCSTCNQYLSVKPVKIYPNRGIKCGRCSTSTDAGVVSLFGILASDALFRCVNRFDGCNRLLKYSQVVEHEELCESNIYECPVCTETLKYGSYNVYMHFKEEHPTLFLKNTAMFNVEVDTELQRTYLYCKNDLLFFVRVIYCKGEEELTLNTLHLGSEENAWKISQNFTLQTLDGKVRHTITGKRCSDINGNVFERKIQICVDDFPKNVVVCKFDLNTEHVDTLLIPPKNYEQKCGTLATVNGEGTSVKSTATPLKGIKSTKKTQTATKSVGTLPKGTLATVNNEDISVKSIETALKGIKSTEKNRTATKSVESLPKELKNGIEREHNIDGPQDGHISGSYINVLLERPFDTYTPTRQPRQSYSSSSQRGDCNESECWPEYEYEDCPEYEYEECAEYECLPEYEDYPEYECLPEFEYQDYPEYECLPEFEYEDYPEYECLPEFEYEDYTEYECLPEYEFDDCPEFEYDDYSEYD